MIFFKNIFKKSQKTEIDYSNLPQHIAIIMDGNGRWLERVIARSVGHRKVQNSEENYNLLWGNRYKILDCLCFFNRKLEASPK